MRDASQATDLNAVELSEQYESAEFDRHLAQAGIGLGDNDRALLSLLDPAGATLEIGCALGRIAFGLERELGFTDVTATDVMPPFISVAARLAAEAGSSVRFELGDVTRLDYEDGRFDQVVCMGVVLSHLLERQARAAAFAEMFRVLRPGGRVVVGVRNAWQDGYQAAAKAVVRLVRTVYNPNRYGPQVFPRLGRGGRLDPFFWRAGKAQVYLYDPAELASDILSAGFSLDLLRTSAQAAEDGFRRPARWLPGGFAVFAIGRKPTDAPRPGPGR